MKDREKREFKARTRAAKKKILKSKMTKKDYVLDAVKDIVGWLVVTAGAFIYWMVLLLILSLVLLSVWHVTFDEILQYSTVLTIITSLLYLGSVVRRHIL